MPRERRNRSTVGRLHSTLLLPSLDVTACGRFAVTAVARTIVDCAARFDRRAAGTGCRRCLSGWADHRGRAPRHARPPARSTRFPQAHRHPRRLTDAITGRPHSWLERRMLTILRAGRTALCRSCRSTWTPRAESAASTASTPRSGWQSRSRDTARTAPGVSDRRTPSAGCSSSGTDIGCSSSPTRTSPNGPHSHINSGSLAPPPPHRCHQIRPLNPQRVTSIARVQVLHIDVTRSGPSTHGA